MAAVTICNNFGAQKNKVSHCFHFLPICHEVMGLDTMIFVFFFFENVFILNETKMNIFNG